MFAAGASSVTLLGELTALPQIAQLVFRGHFVAGEGRKGKGRGWERREVEGSVSPLVFFTI